MTHLSTKQVRQSAQMEYLRQVFEGTQKSENEGDREP